ncbi:MAG: DUF1036 domain-containing protein [Pseudomonadota bacterium]
MTHVRRYGSRAGQRALMAGLIAFLTGLSPTGAKAQFTICNQTLDVFNVAIGSEVDQEFQTEGWWTIAANRCVDVIRKELINRYIYVYATDVFRQPVMDGTVSMCIGADKFVIRGTDACWQRGYRAAHFAEVDTQAVERWTLFVRDESP